MASAKELKALAKPWLEPLLIPMGFQKGRGCTYFRKTEDGVYQIIELIPTRYGKPKLWFTCTIPQLHARFEEKMLPPSDLNYYVGGELSMFVANQGFLVGPEYTVSASKESGMLKFLEALPHLLERWVFPLFNRVVLRERLWEEMISQFPDDKNLMAMKGEFFSAAQVSANNSLQARRP